MAEADKFKVFISWSGSPSKEIAKLLETWLPDIFDNIEPWVSDTGIDPGARAYSSIADALANAQMGIIVTTKANQQAPWITYEAGALSNLFKSEQTRVVPVLVDFVTQSELTSPLSQFQNCMLDEHGLDKLCRLIAKFMGAKPDNVTKRVAAFWGGLHTGVEEVIAATPATATIPSRPTEDVLDDILSTVRAIQRSGDTIINVRSSSYSNTPLLGRPGQVEELTAHLITEARLPAISITRRGTLDGTDYVSVDVPQDVDEAAVQRFLAISARFKGMSYSVSRLLPDPADVETLERALKREGIENDARYDEAVEASRQEIIDAGEDPDDRDTCDHFGEDNDVRD